MPHHHHSHTHNAQHSAANQAPANQAQALGHHYVSAPMNNSRLFVVAIALNLGFVAVEFGFGWFANSTALLADAGHNLSDVLGLFLAWFAEYLMRKPPTERYTYGLRQASILMTLLNALLLFVACGGIVWQAIHRLNYPSPVMGGTVIAVALVGIVINGVSAWVFSHGHAHDLNMRGAYLHMMADAAVSLGVVVSGVVVLYWPLDWLDPAVSLVIVGVIVASTWGLLRDSLRLALNAVPSHVNPNEVAAYLAQCAGVVHVHDLHIWAISTTETALTVHVVMPKGCPNDEYLDDISHHLKTQFDIAHSTIQVEQSTRYHDAPLYMI